eukprot:332596_1
MSVLFCKQSCKHVNFGWISRPYYTFNYVSVTRKCCFTSHQYLDNETQTRAINESKYFSILQKVTKKNKDCNNNNYDSSAYNIHIDNFDSIQTNTFTFNECKNIHEIMNILWNTNNILDDNVYINAIKRCNNLCDFKGALRIFDLMNKNDITQSIEIFNALIECLCDCDRIQLAYKYLNNMEIKPNIKTFEIILSNCKYRISLIDIAENIWKKMIFNYNMIPNINICNIMIGIYARLGDVYKAEIIWKHLYAIKNINAETCAEMIYCYYIKKDEKKLIEMQKFMKLNNIKMNASHYYGIIRYYLSIGKPHKVLLIFDEINKSMIDMNEQLLYQLCLTYLQLKEYNIIIKTLSGKFWTLFDGNYDLNGLLFEAWLIKYEMDYLNDELICVFKQFGDSNKLTGYWCKSDGGMHMNEDIWWIDLHGIYRRRRMVKFILKYIFNIESEYIKKQLRMKQDIVVLCGKGVHSHGPFHGNSKTLCEQELLSWSPPIKCKLYDKCDGCLVLNSDDIKSFYDKYHNL